MPSSHVKARIRSYFGDIIPRIMFHPDSTGLASMERSCIGGGPASSPKKPGPAMLAVHLAPVSFLWLLSRSNGGGRGVCWLVY